MNLILMTMKKLFTNQLIRNVFGLLLVSQFCFAQSASTFLDINDVKALYFSGGDMFWDKDVTRNSRYSIPKNDIAQKHTIFTNGLMISGFDNGGVLHTAGNTYRQTGDDFWPGPLDTTGIPNDPAIWNRVWNVKKSTIDFHKANYQTPNYIVPQEILDWPGNGPAGCSPILAPFLDKDGDGLYEPISGDYPLIKGDQSVYFIFNDNAGTHTSYVGGEPFKIEVHGMAWAINSTDVVLNQTTFLSYSIFNRSANNYYKVKAGFFTDFDLGNPSDDYIKTDTARNLVIAYNADNNDESGQPNGYGLNPPAQGLVYLDRKLTSNFALSNSAQPGVNGDPRNAVELNRYLNGYWADGQTIGFGTSDGRNGTDSAKFMFTGDICAGSGWNESQPKGDRRTISAFSIDTLLAGAAENFNIAFIYARDTSNIASACKLIQATDHINGLFNQGALTGLSQYKKDIEVTVFPNPVIDQSTIKIKSKFNEKYTLSITDLEGRILKTVSDVSENYIIQSSDFSKGIYFIQLKSEDNEYISKFVVN